MCTDRKARISGLTATEHAPRSPFRMTVGDLGTRLSTTSTHRCYLLENCFQTRNSSCPRWLCASLSLIICALHSWNIESFFAIKPTTRLSCIYTYAGDPMMPPRVSAFGPSGAINWYRNRIKASKDKHSVFQTTTISSRQVNWNDKC